MEALEEVVMFSTRPSGRIPLPKRKRTKRHRVQSPFASPIASDREEKISKAGPFSPADSSEVTRGDEMNEEEDMARCLILLARGRFRDHEKRHLSVEEDDGEEKEANNHHHHHHSKFKSKRVLETGEYVYQCKTCDKVFPSFQALGGHRASHKKPKITPPTTIESSRRQIMWTTSMDSASEDEDALSLQLMNTKNSFANTSNNGKQLPKLHECLICGAEFLSGQALGGHMRRHRALMMGLAPALALTPKTPESEEALRPRSKVPSLQLDLNLPAPEDDDPEGVFPINSIGKEGRDRSGLLFSFPALVGCHY